MLPTVQCLVMVLVFVALVVQRYAVELQERICDLVSGRREAAIQRNTLHLGTGDVHAVGFLDVAEVGRFVALGLVGDDGRLHVPDQGPLSGTEEGVAFDVGGTGPGAQTAVLVLDEEFPDE